MILTREILYGDSCEMLRKTMVVYKIQNLNDGKIYIGKTTKTLKMRIAGHISNNRNYYIDNAIKKHAIEAFDVSIVEECSTLDKLNEREKYWIKFYDCKYPNGYNCTDGGEGTPGYVPTTELRALWSTIRTGRRHSDKTRQKMSDSHKGHSVSNETRIKISERTTGKVVSSESRLKMSKSHTGVPLSETHKAHLSATAKNKRRVRCIETGEIFESIAAAAKWAGVAACTMTSTLHGKQKTAGKYHWTFVDD